MEPSRISIGIVLLLSLALVACSEDESPKVEAPAPTIVSFTSSSSEIPDGEAVRLTWQTENAVRLELRDSFGNPIDLGGRQVRAGSVLHHPFDTTTYHLTAYGEGKKTAEAEVTVAVRPPAGKPVIESFTASASEVPVHAPFTLSWSVSGATSVEISDARGAEIDLGDAGMTGEIELVARESTSYRLVARGPGGTAQREVSVSVHGAPVVRFTSPSTVLAPGSTVRLAWVAENANFVTVSDGSGSTILYEGEQLRGDVTVSPHLTTEYLLVARGKGGEASARTTLVVQPRIDEFVVLTPGPVHIGDEVELRWKTRAANSVTIEMVGSPSYQVPEDSLQEGTVRLPAPVGGAFVLVARGGAQEVKATTHVGLDATPRIHDVFFEPPTVTASPDTPAEVSVHWNVDGAKYVRIETHDGRVLDTFGRSARIDSVSTTVTETTTFRIIAENEHGTNAVDRELIAYKAPRVLVAEALPARAETGESLTISWQTEDAATVILERDGVDVGVEPTLVNGTFVDTMGAADTEYVLRTFNSAGFEVASTPFSVVLGNPVIVDFELSSPVTHPNKLVTVSWANVGGQAAWITLDGVEVCRTGSLQQVASGSCDVPSPDVLGNHSFMLHLESGLGTLVTESRDILVTDGPVIESFEAATGLVTAGNPIRFSWKVLADASDTLPTLALVDDLGNIVNLAGADVLQGEVHFAPDEAGIRSYTLTASTESTTADARVVDIDVRGVPEITFAASPNSLSTDGADTVDTVLQWEVTHGVSLSLHTVGFMGDTEEPALFSTQNPAEIASGTYPLTLGPGIYAYRLVVDNGAGHVQTADAPVVVDAVEATLTADKSEIFQGEEVTFTWDVKRADNWSINKPLPLIVEGTDPLIDVPNSPTAEELELSGSTTAGYADYTFPSGFAFPWNDEPITSARISTNGWVAFGANPGTGSTSNGIIPSTSYTYKSLFPFWDALKTDSNAYVPHGKIFVDSGVDATGEYLVIHWHDMGTSGNGHDVHGSLNFQVILWEDGTFAYRYGEMRSDGFATADSQARADGNSASIGYQLSSSYGYLWSYNTDYPGGLSNRSFTYDPRPLPPSGSRTIRVWTGTSSGAASTTWNLTASNDINTVATAAAFNSDGNARANFAWVDAVEPEGGDNYTFSWSMVNPTTQELLDHDGTVLTTQTGTTTKTFTHSKDVPGVYDYVLRVTGKRSWDVREYPLTVEVFHPITFASAREAIDPGDSVQLTWSTPGSVQTRLVTEDGPIDISAQPATGGSIDVSPAYTTTYKLLVTSASGNVREREVKVQVRRGKLNAFYASPLQLPPGGGNVTLSWSATGADSVAILGKALISETSAPFIDIEGAGDAYDLEAFRLHGTTARKQRFDFPLGFKFPWDGEYVKHAWVTAHGTVSFTEGSTSSTNAVLPGGEKGIVHLAPFWDTLYSSSSSANHGSIWWALRTIDGQNAIIIQWAHMRTASTTAADDLNFQVILFENGEVDFRYGVMTTNTAARARGSSATIGYQSLDGSYGETLLHNQEYAPGLANKTWKFKPGHPLVGSMSVDITESTTFTACSLAPGYRDCEDFTVVVLESGVVQFTEIMANPAGGNVDLEWFEVVNTTSGTLDLDGWTLTSGAGESHVINNGGPLLLGPWEAMTFARTANPGFVPDYVYGPDLTLDETGDSLAILFLGGIVDEVEWTGTWFTTIGESLGVEPYKLIGDRDGTAAAWCSSGTLYDGVSRGTPGVFGTEQSCISPIYAVELTDASGFIDIETTGTVVFAGSSANNYDQFATHAGIGFDFPFFSSVLPANAPVGVDGHGYITFDTLTAVSHANTSLPSASGPNNLIALFWDQLAGNSGSYVKTELRTVGARQVRIFQWANYRRFAVSNSHIVMQVQLWSDGDIATILRNLDPPPGGTTSSTAESQIKGGQATVGIEGPGGTQGIQISYDEAIWGPNMGVYYKRR